MDVVNISRSRRFLRERPMHVNLFDRPRLVVDLLCLETGQEESRDGFERSDSLLVLMEGEGRLRAGPQIESLQEMDAVMVPPGQEYTVTNIGAGQLMALVMVTPKPSRASEVRVPGDTRPFRSVRPDPDEPSGISRRTPPRRVPGFEGRDRDMPGPRQGRPFRAGPPPERGPSDHRPAGDRPRFPARQGATDRPRFPRRDEGGEGRPRYPRRDEGGDGRPRYPRRDEGSDQRSERRNPAGPQRARRDDGEGPVWYPKPKPAWRPFGPPPGGGRGRPAGTRGPQGAGPRRPGASQDSGEGASRGARGSGSGGAGGRPGYAARPGSRGRSGGYGGSASGGSRPAGPSRGGPRSEKKTGDARRASRGQGPLSGRRGPGRSGPRT